MDLRLCRVLRRPIETAPFLRRLAYTAASIRQIHRDNEITSIMQGRTESARTAVKRLLSQLNGALRPFDFRRRGQTFARQSDECWQVINVQLSRFSDRD